MKFFVYTVIRDGRRIAGNRGEDRLTGPEPARNDRGGANSLAAPSVLSSACQAEIDERGRAAL